MLTARASGPRPLAAGVRTLSCSMWALHSAGDLPPCWCRWAGRATRASPMKGCRHISAGDMRARGSGCRAPCTKSRARVLPAPSRASRVWKRAHSSCTSPLGAPILTLLWNLDCTAAEETLTRCCCWGAMVHTPPQACASAGLAVELHVQQGGQQQGGQAGACTSQKPALQVLLPASGCQGGWPGSQCEWSSQRPWLDLTGAAGAMSTAAGSTFCKGLSPTPSSRP